MGGHMTRVLWLAVGLTLLASRAEAQEGSVAARLTQPGLDFLARAVPGLLPKTIAVPDLDKELFACSGVNRSVVLHLSGASVDVNVDGIDLGLFTGQVGVSARISLEGRGHVEVENLEGNCTMPIACDVGVSVSSLGIDGTLKGRVDAGVLSLDVPQLDVSVTPDQIQLDVSNCPQAAQLTDFLDAAKRLLLEHAVTVVEDFARANLPPLLAVKLNELLALKGSLLGFDYSVGLASIGVDTTGLDLGVDLGLTYDGPEATCNASSSGEPPAAPPDEPLRLSLAKQSPFVLGVSTRILHDALSAFWRSGLLCLDNAKLQALGLELGELDVASLIPGIPAGTRLGFEIALAAPPTILGGDARSSSADGRSRLALGIAGLELTLKLISPTGEVTRIVLLADGEVAADFDVDPGVGDLGLRLADLSLDRLEIQSSDKTGYTFDPERLKQIVSDIALPLATSKLGRITLTETRFGVLGFIIGLEAVLARPEAIYASLSAVSPPSGDDAVAPVLKLLADSGPLVRAGQAYVDVSANDDQTPAELARFVYRIDGEPESEPTYLRRIKLPITTSGNHTVEIVALDMAGNRSEPQRYELEVDASPPTVALKEIPGPILEGTFAKITFNGSDDRSGPQQLSYRWTVVEKLPDGQSRDKDVRDWGPLADLSLSNLIDGAVYEINVSVRDEAGNLASTQGAFAVTTQSGCRQGPAAPTGWPIVLLWLLSIAAVRLRGGRSAQSP